jgi:hypothetical protein
LEFRRRRRRLASDQWHSWRECDNDPKTDFDVRASTPVTGELCSECKKQQRKGQGSDRLLR